MEDIRLKVHNDFENLKRDKEQYFNQFYSNNYSLVYKICYSVLNNKENSEDVAQIVFEKIYKLPTEKLASSNESSWLYTVSKNEAIQFIRKNKFDIPLDENICEIEEADNGVEDFAGKEEYNSLIKKLNKKQEQIVSLKVLSDFTFKEIGQIMNIPTATVQWHYYKSIRSLRLAVGNLAMFIIAFAFSFKYIKDDVAEHGKSKVNYSNEDTVEQSETSSEPSTSKGNIDSLNSVNRLPNETEQVEQTIGIDSSRSESSTNFVKVGLFSLTGICLILTIVFSIIACRKIKNKK